MKVLIVDDGFVAPHVVRILTDAGHAVTLQSPHPLAASLRDMRFDMVAHLAAKTAADAQAAIHLFAGHAGRIVIASSQNVYAPFAALHRKEERTPSSLPLSEESPLRTLRHLDGNDPDALDVEDAFLAAADRLPLTLLRLPITYGPGDPHHHFFPFIKRIDDARPAILLDPAYGNFRQTHAYVENVAHALTLAITSTVAAHRIYNIGEAPHLKNPTIGERLHELARAARYRGQIVVVPRDQYPPHLLHDLDFRHDLIANDTPLRKELGYTEIVPTDEGFRRTLAWQRAHPPAHLNPADFNYAAEDPLLRAFGLLPRPKST